MANTNGSGKYLRISSVKNPVIFCIAMSLEYYLV
jgi:hypothetical protein